MFPDSINWKLRVGHQTQSLQSKIPGQVIMLKDTKLAVRKSLIRAAMIHLLTIWYISWYKCHDTIHNFIKLTINIILLNCGSKSVFLHLYQHRKHFSKWSCHEPHVFAHGHTRLCQLTINWNYARLCATSRRIHDRKRSKDGTFLSLCLIYHYKGLGLGYGVI